MVIAFSGSQSTGKTSLIQALKNDSFFSHFKVISSPTRELKCAYGMNFNSANTEIQLATLCMQFKNMYSLHTPSNNSLEECHTIDAFLDRSVVDNYAYMRYYMNKGEVDMPLSSIRFIKDTLPVLLNRIDFHVFLHPEFDMVADGIRNIDVDQHWWIDTKIQELFHEFNIEENKILTVSGSIEERVAQLRRKLFS
jgi:nicotinamide riboside kinase